jgi:hypothetical protein
VKTDREHRRKETSSVGNCYKATASEDLQRLRNVGTDCTGNAVPFPFLC